MYVLEKLFYGNIGPDMRFFKRDSEYAKFVKIVSDNEEKLNDFFKGAESEEAQRIFSQLMEARSEIAGIEELEYFIEGFRLGAGFMADTFIITGTVL